MFHGEHSKHDFLKNVGFMRFPALLLFSMFHDVSHLFSVFVKRETKMFHSIPTAQARLLTNLQYSDMLKRQIKHVEN